MATKFYNNQARVFHKKEMITQLGKKALQHVKRFSNLVKDFEKVENAIKILDLHNTGFGHSAISAKIKLQAIAELKEDEFVECYKFL